MFLIGENMPLKIPLLRVPVPCIYRDVLGITFVHRVKQLRVMVKCFYKGIPLKKA